MILENGTVVGDKINASGRTRLGDLEENNLRYVKSIRK